MAAKLEMREKLIQGFNATEENRFAQCNSYSGGLTWSKLRKLPLDAMKEFYCVGWANSGYQANSIPIFSRDKDLKPKKAK